MTLKESDRKSLTGKPKNGCLPCDRDSQSWARSPYLSDKTYLCLGKCIRMLIVITVDRKANSSISSKINSIVIYLPILIVYAVFLKSKLAINNTKIFTRGFWLYLSWDTSIFIFVWPRLSGPCVNQNYAVPSWTNPEAYPFSLCWIILKYCFCSKKESLCVT